MNSAQRPRCTWTPPTGQPGFRKQRPLVLLCRDSRPRPRWLWVGQQAAEDFRLRWDARPDSDPAYPGPVPAVTANDGRFLCSRQHLEARWRAATSLRAAALSCGDERQARVPRPATERRHAWRDHDAIRRPRDPRPGAPCVEHHADPRGRVAADQEAAHEELVETAPS